MSIDPLQASFFDVNGAPLPGLTPSFVDDATYNGYWKTAAGVDATPPSVTDGGDGDYTFAPSATDLNTGVRYRLDGGPTAYPRYAHGVVESSASAAAQTSVAAEDLNLFGVTAASLYARHFPQLSVATTDSNPSLATVLEIIDEQAAALSGYLLAEDIEATGLTVSNSPAYLWCRETLRLMAAIQVASVMTQQQVPLLPAWEKQLAARLKDLDERGDVVLGFDSGTLPNGPTHHIDTYNLDIGDPYTEASDVVPPFRKSDAQ